MKNKRNIRLITKVLIIGALIAVLGYLFHPEVGQISLVINGQPVAPAPISRITATATVLVMMGLVAILTILLFLGIGVFIFWAALLMAFMICLMLAPYFWPVLLVIFLLIAIMSISHKNDEA